MHMKAMVPQFTVRDITISQKFYKDVMGFELETEDSYWAHEDDILWVRLKSGDVVLMLSHETMPEMPVIDATVYYFYPEDVEKIHEELEEKGFDVTDLRSNERGYQEFDLIDPDRRRLVFEG